ncbi:vacuolar-sorting BRO1, putative [Babesia ovata]|uniref:Vacuolar-sorting BRO1, putative n=1 Tax=Babesia ovata TaxID=189622 RepID=A0A2H6KF04_9APIC|nr:vacuolar-sorting BRO1, putative [Babesia ovata]GBE61583.1 vacuolar-sorting BRO1, putative [Babesia ovata]
MRSYTPAGNHVSSNETIEEPYLVPPSINRVCCFSVDPLCVNVLTPVDSYGAGDEVTKQMVQGVIASVEQPGYKKVSLAIIALPQEEDLIIQDGEMGIFAVDEVKNVHNSSDDILGDALQEDGVKLHEDREVERAPLSITEEQIAVEKPQPDISAHLDMKSTRIRRQMKRRRKGIRVKRRKSRVTDMCASPVPDRQYGTRGIKASIKQGINRVQSCHIAAASHGEDMRPESVVKHLKRATQLLLKRKKRTCVYVAREFDELRQTIETKFHLVLCRCQERWNSVNATYIKSQRLDEITGGIRDDLKLPPLERLVKQLPEPIRLQHAPNVDLCTTTLDRFDSGRQIMNIITK